MSKDCEPTSRAAGIAVVVLVLFAAVPCLYVLSLGPAAWLVHRGYLDGEEGSLAVHFYWPLIWLSENNPTANRVLEGYMSLWGQP